MRREASRIITVVVIASALGLFGGPARGDESQADTSGSGAQWQKRKGVPDSPRQRPIGHTEGPVRHNPPFRRGPVLVGGRVLVVSPFLVGSYVQGYVVQNGMAFPLTVGVVPETPYTLPPAAAEPPQPAPRLTSDQQRALDKFFADTLSPKQENQGGASPAAGTPSE